MRLLATIFLVWPISVFGHEIPDASPPFGLWECSFSCLIWCDLDIPGKMFECEPVGEQVCVDDIDLERLIIIDLRSTPYSLKDSIVNNETEVLHYLGQKAGRWVLFNDAIEVSELDPNKGKIVHMGYLPDDLWPPYSIMQGTCTNITPNEPEKPTTVDKAKE